MDFGTEFQPTTVQPEEIVEQSFAMVTAELGAHDFSDEQFPIVRRAIHTSADFELGRSLVFHDRAIRSGVQALQSGTTIVVDTHMIEVGITKRYIERFGCKIDHLPFRLDLGEESTQIGRMASAIRTTAQKYPDAMYIFGSESIALMEFIRLVETRVANPSLIVGVPVGFVHVLEAKNRLMQLDVPHISNHSPKGGSAIAVSIVNALAIMAGG